MLSVRSLVDGVGELVNKGDWRGVERESSHIFRIFGAISSYKFHQSQVTFHQSQVTFHFTFTHMPLVNEHGGDKLVLTLSPASRRIQRGNKYPSHSPDAIATDHVRLNAVFHCSSGKLFPNYSIASSER